ncbi:unnamed protein product [Caenorhabditis nigoni]|uniref:Uncharacterized protein n=1 Tax=Caenorhabditis nigoni TaxID=1611254 RepID=A0A2G5VDR6_9PELO|nr:hypothetical protein B9Z55_001015 [Caenorhabditis nigoni]
MALPSLKKRPNETNSKILRSHEFLRQSSQLIERSLINAEGSQMLEKMLTKMVAEAEGKYALDEEGAKIAQSGKLLEDLKATYQTSMAVMEERFLLTELAREVQQKKLDVNRNYTQCDLLRKATQSKNAEICRERNAHEKRLQDAKKTALELSTKHASIQRLLENSTDVGQLRTIEEEKGILEKEVDLFRSEKIYLAEDIRTKTSTLKAESKKTFQKTIIECAKQYTLFQTLTPKLMSCKTNLERLKNEEEIRRACGSLDETMQFDRSFVLASMEKEKSPEKTNLSPPVISKTSQKVSSRSTSFNESIQQPDQMEVGEFEEDGKGNQSKNESSEKINTSRSLLEDITVFPTAPVPQIVDQAPKRRESVVETQRVVPRDPSPEPVDQSEEIEKQADESIDVMELDNQEDEVEPMEEESQEQTKQGDLKSQKISEKLNSSVTSSLEFSKFNKPAVEVQKSNAPEVLDISDHGDSVADTPMRVDEDDILSENGSNRSTNFSFNFFGNTKSGAGADVNGVENDTDGNFDFNFGSIGAGDDGLNNGSGGAFDFLGFGGDEEGTTSSTNASDPFGFGASAAGSGGGDTSFNLNFDGDNEGGGTSGAGGNSTSFFNF